MPAVPNLYDTNGQVVGYITKGDSPTDIQGVIYWTSYTGSMIGKAFVGLNKSGHWILFKVNTLLGATFPVAFTGEMLGEAINFTSRPFSSPLSALTALNNQIPLEFGGVRPQVTTWAAAAALGGSLLMLSKDTKRRR